MVEITITHLTGARRNAVETFATLPLKLGRAGECQVRFDPEQDAKVSATHAELRGDGEGGLVVVDLGSKNGVLVNGVRVDGSAGVPNHAVLEVGAGGPRLKLTFQQGASAISFSRLRAPAPGSAAERPNLRTTDETPAYQEADLEPTTRSAPPARGSNAGALIALAVVLVGAAVVAFVVLRGG
ncbi:MAG: FHA domain-containing protein [Planctomycetes bacterium]|nr:FHA domain-containing protein [Planctomycetota bacterium]